MTLLGDPLILAETPHPALLRSVQITHALAALLGTCTRANGYLSNVGATVRLGQLRGAAVQAPCVILIPGRHRPTDAIYAPQSLQAREFEIRAALETNAFPTLSDIELVDAVIWDVRRCLAAGRDALSALDAELRFDGDQPAYRDDGGTVVGAALTYTCTYSADPADPDNPD